MLNSATILAGLPTGLRDPLIASYREIAENFSVQRWEPSELNGGKFCEVVYCISKGCIDGNFPAKPKKPKDMASACRALENSPSNQQIVGERSIRILIPRALLPLYEIRNNRGVGHVGGDVDPNHLDATAVYGMASWILAELIRIFHGVSIKDAQGAVDMLVERKNPLVWNVNGTDMRRVLRQMGAGDQVLLLLYSQTSWVDEKDLFRWVEYSDHNLFRTRILKSLHKQRVIEFDEENGRVHISPLGNIEVEKKIAAGA